MSNATYQLTITGIHYNQFVENVLVFRAATADGVQTLTEGADLIQAWLDNISNAWLSVLPPTYQIDRLSARCLLPVGPNNEAHQQVINDALIGLSGTGAVAENLCPVVNLIPPMGVKSQGRVYMPCIAKTDLDSNQYAAGYISAIGTLFTNMQAGFSNSSLEWFQAIYSKKNFTSSLALSFSLSAAIGFQGRRRKPI